MNISININDKDYKKLDKYGFYFEKNIQEYLHGIAEEIRKAEKAAKESKKDPFKAVTAVYTGGGVWLFYGELISGAYFLGDNDGSIRLLNASPDNFEESLYAEWQEEHLIKDLEGKERVNFCDKLASRLLRHVEGDDFGGLCDEEIQSFKKYWRLPL